MSIVFSPSTRAFYPIDTWPHDLPDDIVAVEAKVHARLFEDLGAGKILDVDANGYPVAVVAPSPSASELASQARRRRDREIGDLQWLIERHRGEAALNLSTTLTHEDYLLVLQHVQDLRDVPEQDQFPSVIDWPVLPEEILATGA